MKEFFFFLLVLSFICLFASTVFSQDCIGVLNGATTSRPGCPYPVGNRYDWRDTDLVSWGDGSPGRQWVRSAFGQCRSGLNCPPTVGIIVHSRGLVSQRWTNGLTALNEETCVASSEIIYTQRPDACTPCGNQTGVTCGGGGGGGTACYPTGGGGGFGCNAGYYFGFQAGGSGQCCPYSSPLLLDIDGDGYEMTDYYYGVPFDVNGDGSAGQTSWTATNSDDAWIVLDRNENNRIDSGLEMFGDASEQPVTQNPRNGFASLAVFDTVERGGNADGKITRDDAVFRQLRLWQDRNHNGISEPEEMSRLPALDVVAIDLDYRESRRTDQYGNRFRFRARVRDRNDARVGRWAWDVFLKISPPNNPSP